MNYMNHLYSLSNISNVITYETNIVLTEFGQVFNQKASQLLDCEIIAATTLIHTVNDWINGSHYRENAFSLYLYERGIPFVPSIATAFGRVAYYRCGDLRNISDPLAEKAIQAMRESIDECHLPPLPTEIEGQPFRYQFVMTEFDQYSRFAYLSCNVRFIEKELKKQYPDLSFLFRTGEDFPPYYLIFETEADLKMAERKYGIENIERSVWEICKKNDPYHVFREPLSAPRITTNEELKKQGRIMGIMRNQYEDLGWFLTKKND